MPSSPPVRHAITANASRQQRAVLAVTRAIRILVLLGLPAISSAQQGDSVPSATYIRAQQLVAVDGQRRINMYCAGSGSPTVLLDAGARENMMAWRHVQKQLSAVTHVCAYDRAGYGFSDAAARESDVTNTVADLQLLIRNALHTPIVYVGHSIAGLYGTLLASRYPEDVAGMVLVDPATAHQSERAVASFTTAERAETSRRVSQILGFLQRCVDLARAGKLQKPYSQDAVACVNTQGYAEPIDNTLQNELERQYALPKSMNAAQSEFRNFLIASGQTMSTDDQQMDEVNVNLGHRPLIVLSAGKTAPAPPGISAAHQASSEAAWLAAHLKLAQKSTRGQHIVVRNAAHHIQFDQPAAVIDAVTQVIQQVRQTSK